jgi:hypothetical protein
VWTLQPYRRKSIDQVIFHNFYKLIEFPAKDWSKSTEKNVSGAEKFQQKPFVNSCGGRFSAPILTFRPDEL